MVIIIKNSYNYKKLRINPTHIRILDALNPINLRGYSSLKHPSHAPLKKPIGPKLRSEERKRKRSLQIQ